MAEFPALPIWTDALLADCGHLSDAEFGAYLKLLIAMWRAPDQRLPNDENWLARRFGRSVEDYQKTMLPIVQEFCKSSGNWITQKRLRTEFDYLHLRREKQSARAKVRWERNNPNAVALQGGMPPAYAASGNALSTPTPTIKKEKKDTPLPPKSSDPPNGSARSALGFDDFWKAYPRREDKGHAEKAWAKAISSTDPIAITGAASKFASSCIALATERKFIPLPATWLNGKRWLDEQTPPLISNGAPAFPGMEWTDYDRQN